MTTTAVAAASLEALTQHQPWMFAQAYQYTGNSADAQDAVQEAYLRYIERAPAEVENPKAYLSKILDNVLHASRRGFGRFELPSDEIGESPIRALSPGSFNYTAPANEYNDENIFVIGSPYKDLPEREGGPVDLKECRKIAGFFGKEIDRIVKSSESYS